MSRQQSFPEDASPASVRIQIPTAPSRVLLIDDDVAVGVAYTRILQKAGYEVIFEFDGQKAVDKLLSMDFCAIVSDIKMPRITGIDLLRLVKVHDLDSPVLLITGGTDLQTAAEAINYGAAQLLVKPIEPQRLVGEVKRAAKLCALNITRRHAMRLLSTDQQEATRLDMLLGSFRETLGGLWMALQPIVAKDGSIAGYEALMRSSHPSLSNPGLILDAATRLGRLDELGQVCRERAALAFQGAPPDTLLFVNLHARDLIDPGLYSHSSPLAPIAERVVFEITERAALDDVPDLRERISQLHAAGYRIAVDDLGAGYSGLNSFALLDPDFAKLDMSLVRDIHRNNTKRTLASHLISACHDINISVVAEGIETRAEWDCLRGVGCPLFQGYLLARPGRPFPSVDLGAIAS